MPQHTPDIPAGGRAVSSALTAPCVWLHGDAASIMYVRRVLYTSGLLNSPLRLRLAETAGVARLAIHASQTGYEVCWRPETHGAWFAMYQGSDISEVLKHMQQAARWHTLSRLEHSWSLQERILDVDFELWSIQSVTGKLHFQPRWSMHTSTTSTVYLENADIPGTCSQPVCEIRIANKNPHNQPIYVALYVLAENYTVGSLLSGSCRRLEPGTGTRVRVAGNLPNEFVAAGLTQTSTLIKLLVSDCAFNAEQIGNPSGNGVREKVIGGKLPERPAAMPDTWVTSQLRVFIGTAVPHHKI
jgi:hypothetical protein